MDWKIKKNLLTKEFEFNNFVQAVKFVNKIMVVAQKANHHPDILIHSYSKVKIILTTHDKKKVTEKDYSLAKKIDEILK